jgi:hypothetical protein
MVPFRFGNSKETEPTEKTLLIVVCGAKNGRSQFSRYIDGPQRDEIQWDFRGSQSQSVEQT